MIDKIQYSDELSALVFDEPIDEYRQMMLLAASDNSHDLHKNYKGNMIQDTFFCVLVYYNDMPVEIFGLEKSELCTRAARGYYRAYKPKEIREQSICIHLDYSKFIMQFYDTYSHYHKEHGIDTIYVTRNYKPQNRFFSKYLNKAGASYYDYAGTYLYRKTLQDFYVWGRKEILSNLPVHQLNKQAGHI